MKKLFPSREALMRCYPPVPDAYREALARSLDALPDRKPAPRKRGAAALVFALCLLLLTAAAAVIAGGVLSYLGFDGSSAPDDGLRVSPVAAQCTLDGVNLRAVDAVSDGRRLAFSLEAQSASREELYLLEPYACTVNGEAFASDFEVLCEGWLPGFFSGDAQGGMELQGGVLGELRQESAGSLDVVMTYTLSVPANPVVIVDERLYDSSAVSESYGEDARYLYACAERLRAMPQVVIAGEDQLDADEWMAQGYTVLNLSGVLAGDADALLSGSFFHPVRDGGQLRQIGLMELRFTVPVESGEAYTLSAAPVLLEDGGEIAFEHLVYTPLTFQVECAVTIPADSQEEALAYCAAHGFGRLPVFADAQGDEIAFPDVYGGIVSSGPYLTEYGGWRLEWDWALIPPRELPAELHLLCADADAALREELFEKAVLRTRRSE